MADDEYRSIKVSKSAYAELLRLQNEVREHGMAIFPSDLRKSEEEGRAASMGDLVSVGLRAVRQAMKRKT
jgi:hypothetical protein